MVGWGKWKGVRMGRMEGWEDGRMVRWRGWKGGRMGRMEGW